MPKMTRKVRFDSPHSFSLLLVYHGDDSFVPKNTTVVVKRIPVPQGTGLLTRLGNAHRSHAMSVFLVFNFLK
jgi:hypothetical protein